jgi:hypothetical protein
VPFPDVVMPGMSGISLAPAGFAFAATGEEKAAMDEFPLIAKPYTLAQILKEVRAAA